MDPILLVVIVVVILAIVIVGIQHMPVIGSPWNGILIFLACVIAAYFLIRRLGLA